jgi:peptidoglycan/xylan/chitin deacetylase (PgdA/CDA1 family)
MKNFGSFVISLDFELFWGVRHNRTIDSYGKNIIGAREVIPRIVELFSKYNVHSTFAIVGLLFCRNKKEINQYKPLVVPTYKNAILSPYANDYINSLADSNDPYHSAYEIIQSLKQNRFIEVASHTFSHYYCWEEGQNTEQFEADVQSYIRLAADNDLLLKSIVFPRNQVTGNYLQICYKYGIDVFRGNPVKYYDSMTKKKNVIIRFIDSYFNFGNNTTYAYEEILQDKLYNVKASRFLRPYLYTSRFLHNYSYKLKFLEKLKIKRIKDEMTYAAKHNRVYHLWWHPHNFGIYQTENLKLLETILVHYQQLAEQYNFKSFTMGGLSNLLKD